MSRKEMMIETQQRNWAVLWCTVWRDNLGTLQRTSNTLSDGERVNLDGHKFRNMLELINEGPSPVRLYFDSGSRVLEVGERFVLMTKIQGSVTAIIEDATGNA